MSRSFLGEAFAHEDRRDSRILRGGLKLGTADLRVDEVVKGSSLGKVSLDEGGELCRPWTIAVRRSVVVVGELVEARKGGFREALVRREQTASSRR